MPAARCGERPAPEEWSTNGVMAHWRAVLLFLRLHHLDHAGQLQKIAAALAGTARRPSTLT